MFRNYQFCKCLLCNEFIQDEQTWVHLVKREFPLSVCSSCKSSFEPIHTWIEDVYCLYAYNQSMKDYFHRFKFGKDLLLANVFRNELRQNLLNISSGPQKENIPIVPIPMHRHNIQLRTFCQVDELLKAANLPYKHLLEKVTTTTQSSKNREQRLNTKKLFEMKNKITLSTIVLFDDIKTTGTTLKLAERELKNAGVEKVVKVVLAAVL